MNRSLERSPNATVHRNALGRDLISSATKRIQGWFRQPDREQLSHELNLCLEELRAERARIARELHDTLLQSILGASLLLDNTLQQLPADSPIRPSLSRTLCLMHRVIEEARLVLQGLRTQATVSGSLEQAFSDLFEEFAPAHGAQLRVSVSGQTVALKPTIQEQVYMIGREALFNALRHAHAKNIEAELEYLPRQLRVVVRDNGCGIDHQELRSERDSHWGLLGMHERALAIGARLRIWSKRGAGTEVEISISSDLSIDAHSGPEA